MNIIHKMIKEGATLFYSISLGIYVLVLGISFDHDYTVIRRIGEKDFSILFYTVGVFLLFSFVSIFYKKSTINIISYLILGFLYILLFATVNEESMFFNNYVALYYMYFYIIMLVVNFLLLIILLIRWHTICNKND